MKGKVVAIISGVFVLYVLFGAVCFHLIESPNEVEQKERAEDLREEIRANLTEVLTQEQIATLVNAIGFVLGTGTDIVRNSSSPTNWDINSAFFFSGTVVTTIGFGNNAPQTQFGRNFCIIYALIGIPLCGFLLTGIGEKLGFLAKKLEGVFYDRVTCYHPVLLRLTYISVLLLIGGILFITIPSIIFSHVEEWDLSESWYFCFITLTTIGFGDYVIGTRPSSEKLYSSVYPWVCYVWIIVGMSFLALIISLLSDLMSDYAGKLREEQKQRLKQLKTLTGKQLTRLGSSEKKAGHRSEADAEDGEGGRNRVEEEVTPLDASGEKVKNGSHEKDQVGENGSHDRDQIRFPGATEKAEEAAVV